MAKEKLFGQILIKCMMECGKTDVIMVKAFIKQTIVNIEETSEMINFMGKASLYGLMENITKEIMLMEKNKDLEDINISMGKYMKANGWMESKEEKVD